MESIGRDSPVGPAVCFEGGAIMGSSNYAGSGGRAVLFCTLAGADRTTRRSSSTALDLAPPQEELSEFPLGKYTIPIPVAEDRGIERA